MNGEAASQTTGHSTQVNRICQQASVLTSKLIVLPTPQQIEHKVSIWDENKLGRPAKQGQGAATQPMLIQDMCYRAAPAADAHLNTPMKSTSSVDNRTLLDAS
jgi:hypothetical protein